MQQDYQQNDAVYDKHRQYFEDKTRMIKMPTAQSYEMPPTMEELVEAQQLAGKEQVSVRGRSYSDLFSCLVAPLLRLGLLIQLVALIMLMAIYYGHGGTGAMTYDLFNLPEKLRTSESFSLFMIGIQAAFFLGASCILGFQVFAPDSSQTARGFRAGSKLLNTAATLDLLVTSLRLLQYIYAYQFLSARWWLKYVQTKADWVLFYFGAVGNSLSLFLYGLAFFYLEAYHDEGTFEEFAWVNLILFGLAGFFECLMALTGFGAFFSFVQVAALASTTVWAFSFEPLVNYHAKPLHDRNINEVAE